MDSEADDRPLLIFDGDCSFCRAWVEYWRGLTGERVRYAPFQEAGEQFPQVSRGEFASAVKLILPDGKVRSGAYAAFTALASIPDKRWLLWLYERLPGAGTICEAAYGVIARHRSFAFEVTRLLWGIPASCIGGACEGSPARAVCALLVAGRGGTSLHDLPVGRATARGRISRSVPGIGSRNRKTFPLAAVPADVSLGV